jgi:hypothetical protein
MSEPWFHGSDVELTVLRAGSSVTRDRELARAFSRRPALLGHFEGSVRHNGIRPGYLYAVAEQLGADDLEKHPHPSNESEWEWLVRRDVAVRLIERTEIRAEELFTDEEIERIRAKQCEVGVETFTSDEPTC